MKNKIILALLCVTLFCQSLTVFAENTEYDANENYTSSAELSNDRYLLRVWIIVIY